MTRPAANTFTHSSRRRSVRTGGALLGLSMALVAGCAEPVEPFEPRTIPATAKETVTDLLPIGPHLMQLTFNKPTGRETKVEGYIHLPESYDLEQDCAFDLSATESIDDGSVTTFSFSKAPGAAAWRRVNSTDDNYASVGEWFDGDDPSGLAPVLLFPALLLQDSGGGFYWCNMRHLDQIAVLADKTEGRLEWSRGGYQAVRNANNDAWLSGYLTAAGLTGDAYNVNARELSALLGASSDFLLDRTELHIDGDAGRRVFTVYSRGDGELSPIGTIAFTPTNHRDVTDISGARTYFEKVADEAAGNEGLIETMLETLRTQAAED